MTETTEPTEATGWDRRRFIKASAGGAALIWAAPTVTGLDARAFAAGSCAKVASIFKFVTEEATPSVVTNYAGPFVTTSGSLIVTQGNVDTVGPGTSFPSGYTPVKTIDMTGGSGVTVTVLDGGVLPTGDYVIELEVYGSITGGTGTNNALVQVGGVTVVDTGTPADNVAQLFSFSQVGTGVGGQLEIRHTSTADLRGLFLKRLEVFTALC